MFGLGTIVNALAIVAGGLIGLFAGKLLTQRFQNIINAAMALSILAMSLSGIVAQMLVPEGEGFTTRGTYLLIASLVLGGILGELLDLDGKMERFGVWLKQKTGNARDAKFVDAFVDASLTVCIGAMAVMGSILDGIDQDHSILFMKAVMDFVIILAMAASKGKGCLFSAIPVFLFQGCITLLARLIAPAMTDAAMNALSLVGSVLILCVALNLLLEGKFRIKVANLLPAIIFAAILGRFPIFF